MISKPRSKKKKKIEYLNNLKLFWKLTKKYRSLIYLVVFVVLIMTGINVLVKYLFKYLIDYGTSYASGSISKIEFKNVLIILAEVYIASYVIRTALYWLQMHLINHIDAGIIFELKRKFFNHIITLSHRFHTTHKTGSLISRFGRGSRSVEGIMDFFIFNSLPLLFQLIIVSTSLVYFDKISALVVVITAVVFVIYSLYVLKVEQIPKREANDFEDKEKGISADFFTNIDSIKYFGKEERVKSLYLKLISEVKNKILRAWGYFRWLDSGQSFIVSTGLFFVVLFPTIKFFNNEISIGTLAFIYTIYGNITEPLFGFIWGVRRFFDSMTDLQSLADYDKEKNEIVDKSDAKILKIDQGSIEFNDVKFGYKDRQIINGISLKIQPNEKIALVGLSGSGKTTLVKLLYRFYDVNSGSILIDKRNIKDFKQDSLRSELSIVPQDCLLFDDTIYNNIAFSRHNATYEEVMKAIKFAQLDKFISKLAKKENTIVGERGVKLSGGERQRVSIARAILANKRILLLDEATSALDSKTEHEIQQDLWKLMEGRTVIIIAHRLSTIMKADKVVVISKGKIAQIGKHSDLIKEKGIYRELWSLQKDGYIH